ncbi:MAG: hypothetical protein PUP91_02570, partial [Rhizonema sp. PD37]|nr:hypothetical protein [Rhizonema sp. PD37]
LNKLKEQQDEKYREALAYLIPEQVKFISTKVKSPRFQQSAQYSLGLLAYELFTYEIPTTFQDHKDLIKQEFPKLTSFVQKCPNCPRIIERIILKMVSPEPEERYENIHDAIELIQRHIDFDFNTVKESYKRCAFEQNFDNTFFDIFYEKFIAKCPEAAKKFSTFEEKEEEKKKEYWNRQHQLLKQAVLVLFAYFEEKDQLNPSDYYSQEEPNILTRIAEIHDRHHKNIPISMYKAFVDALVETIIDFDPWCKENQETDNEVRRMILKKAWNDVLTPGVEYMKTKY